MYMITSKLAYVPSLTFNPYCTDRNFCSDEFGFIQFNINLK